MDVITRFITQQLKLKVNDKKSAVNATAGPEVSRIQFYRRFRDSAQEEIRGITSLAKD